MLKASKMPHPDPTPDRQKRSSFAEAHLWVSRLTTISLEMALPALLGHWLDTKWETKPVMTAIGAFLGFGCGLAHLLRMTKEAERKDRKSKSPSSNQTESSSDENIEVD